MAKSRFILKKSKNARFYFNLLAKNGEIIVTSEMYASKSGALKGIRSVQVNAPEDGRYQRLLAKGDKHYFNLTAMNHRVIASSQRYATKRSCESGITSVKKNAPAAEIEDLA